MAALVLKVKTAPAEEPVTLAEAKNHLRVDDGLTADDSLIGVLITAARERVEALTNRAIIDTEFEYFLQEFPSAGHQHHGATIHGHHGHHDKGDVSSLESHLIHGQADDIVLPRSAPLISVSAVEYTDEDDVTKTVPSSIYRQDLVREPGRIVLKNDEEWPTDFTDLASVNPVKVTYRAGFADAAAVPASIKQAILLIVGHLYENRENVVGRGGVVQFVEIPQGAQHLLDPWRLFV